MYASSLVGMGVEPVGSSDPGNVGVLIDLGLCLLFPFVCVHLSPWAFLCPHSLLSPLGGSRHEFMFPLIIFSLLHTCNACNHAGLPLGHWDINLFSRGHDQSKYLRQKKIGQKKEQEKVLQADIKVVHSNHFWLIFVGISNAA